MLLRLAITALAFSITVNASAGVDKKAANHSQTLINSGPEYTELQTVRLSLSNCSLPVNLTAPEAFSKAVSTANWDRQDQVLSTLNGNLVRKANYQHVLMKEWNAEFTFPYIAVGTLKSVSESQGNITDSQWQAIKSRLLNLQTSELENPSVADRIRQFQRQKNHRYNPRLNQIIDVIESNADSLTILGKFGQKAGTVSMTTPVNVFSAVKVYRLGRCVAVASLFFYSEEADVANRLQQLSAKVSLKH